MLHRIPFFLPLLYPSLTWSIPGNNRELYLTFDDGPVPGPTDFVLDVLERFDAKATFFCIGDNIRKHEAVFQKVIARGHRVGNHTYNHYNGWKKNTVDYLENVVKCQQLIEEHNGGPVLKPLFRPPYGRITRNQIRRMRDFRIIMWDVLSMDYNQQQSPETCLRQSIRATRSGSVIVFHDSFKAERNLTHALPRFIEHFTERGFSFQAIPQ